jgi:hypothetical protein
VEEFLVPNDKALRVARAKTLLAGSVPYPKGCSELVSAVLGITYAQAAAILGTNPTKIGSNGSYTASPGDVIGWLANPDVPEQNDDHVAIYIGDADCKIIDVKGLGQKPRKLSSYGKVDVFLSDKY